jgi:ferredoxin
MNKQYFLMLSKTQKLWLAGTLFVAFAIIAVGLVLQSASKEHDLERFTTTQSIKQIAPHFSVTGKALARELGLPLDISKTKPLNELGISQETLDHVVEHLMSHTDTTLKYYVFVSLVLFGTVFMTRLGRPDNSSIKERKLWYPRLPYILCLMAAVIVCGFVLGKSPNPMEGTVKLFKAMVGLYPSVTAKAGLFLFFLALALIANKIICGWACPFGALQELLYTLPVLRKWKQWKAPFLVTNTIRAVLFVLMLLLLFGIIGDRRGFVLYHYLNPFNLFNFDFEEVPILLTIVFALLFAFFMYRPFCTLICPFGFLSWIAERISLKKIRIDKEKCTECGACVKACPLEAAKGRVEGNIFTADCFSCARCLNVCPSDAIDYR